jgi:HEAT repeat protein
VDALVYILNNDESYYARAYAAYSLGFYVNSEKAFTSLVDATKQDSINDQIRYRAFLGFIEMKNTKTLPIAIEYLKNGKEFPGRNAAAYAVGKLGRGNPEAMKALLSTKDIDEFRVRAESAFSITYLEDPSVIPELEAWLSQESAGYVRRRLRETINTLRRLSEGNPKA